MKKVNKYILAIETSSNYLGLGLFDNENKLSIINHYLTNSHDTLLADSIKYLLGVNNIHVNDLDYVTISSGPGSFTGLRIGASLTKALCFEEDFESSEDIDELIVDEPKNPKLISVSSLEILLIDFINNNLKQILSNNINLGNSIIPEFKVNIFLKSHKNIYYKQVFELNLKKEQIENYKKNNFKNLYSHIDSKFDEIELIEVNENFISQLETISKINNFNITNSIELIEILKNQDNTFYVELNVENLIHPTLKKIANAEFENPSTFVPLYSQEFKLNNNNNNNK